MAKDVRAAGVMVPKCPVVAIVEDDEAFRKYLAVLFETNGCRVEEASCGRELFDILAAQRVDCVILDYNLADENGLVIHAQVKSDGRDVPPIVMLTGERDERAIINAFRGGISDYVLKKDLKLDELFAAVAGAIERHEQARALAERTSEYDEATGLHSRAAIVERLAGMTGNRRVRSAIMLIAVNNLHDLGERFGQAVADRALRSFVARLKRALGPYDVGGRYDDAQFIVITDVDMRFKTIEFACERLAREVSFDVDVDAVAFKLIVSIGAATHPLNGNTVHAVLAAAEQALKKAKATGTSCTIAEAPDYSPPVNASFVRPAIWRRPPHC